MELLTKSSESYRLTPPGLTKTIWAFVFVYFTSSYILSCSGITALQFGSVRFPYWIIFLLVLISLFPYYSKIPTYSDYYRYQHAWCRGILHPKSPSFCSSSCLLDNKSLAVCLPTFFIPLSLQSHRLN